MDRMRAQMRGDRPRRPEGVRFDPARPAAHGDAPSPHGFPISRLDIRTRRTRTRQPRGGRRVGRRGFRRGFRRRRERLRRVHRRGRAPRRPRGARVGSRDAPRRDPPRRARGRRARGRARRRARARADLEDELEELRAFVRAGGGRVPARAADASRPSSASASAGDEELARLRDQLRESLDARSEDARAAAAAAARAAALIDDLEALNVRFAEDAIAADEAETRARDEIRSARDAVSAAESRADAAESRLDAALEAAKATATIRIPTGPSRVVSPSSSDEAAAAAERAARAWREDVRRETTLTRSALADMDAMDARVSRRARTIGGDRARTRRRHR